MGCGASTAAAPAGAKTAEAEAKPAAKPASTPEPAAVPAEPEAPATNADGSIDRKAVLAKLFATVDADGDGHVTLAEFCAMFDDTDLDKDANIDDDVKEQFSALDADGACPDGLQKCGRYQTHSRIRLSSCR